MPCGTSWLNPDSLDPRWLRHDFDGAEAPDLSASARVDPALLDGA